MDKVIVTDVNMKFFSMVKVMIKWILASIPAALILIFFYMFIYGAIISIITAGR